MTSTDLILFAILALSGALGGIGCVGVVAILLAQRWAARRESRK